MPIIKRHCIENIKAKVSIYDLVLPYVQLKRSGANWCGLSPFTEEKTPSFYALSQKNIFKCFSSGHAGDIFKFIELKEHLHFNEAVETIAKRFNLPVEYESSSSQTGQISLRKELYALHESARSYYHQAFNANTPQSKIIQDYFFDTRKFSKKIAQTFYIGYAPVHDTNLLKHLLKSFSLSALKESGLFYFREHETNPHNLKPRFSGRLIIPINDIQGRPIAFTARQTSLTPKEESTFAAKYINSPETPIFSKSHILFGLDYARQHLDKSNTPFVLVEGQLDVLRLVEQGIHTAIAPQGTAITESQLSLVRRYTNTIECLLDGDKAGQKAALRALPLALKTGLDIQFLPLPPSTDPDVFFQQHSIKGYQALQAKALGPIEFAYQTLIPSPHPNPTEKSQALENIYPIIHQCTSAVTQQSYLSSLAYIAKVDPGAVMQDFQNFKNRLQKYNNHLPKPLESVKKNEKYISEKLTTVEYELLLILLHHDDLIEPISAILDPAWISRSSMHGQLLARFIQEVQEGMCKSFLEDPSLIQTQEEYNCIYSLLAESPPFSNIIQIANACIKTIFSNYIQIQKQAIEKNINSLDANDSSLRNLLEKRLQLRKIQQNPPQLELTFAHNAK